MVETKINVLGFSLDRNTWGDVPNADRPQAAPVEARRGSSELLHQALDAFASARSLPTTGEVMNEENMEALARVRAHGQALKNGAPHQQPIGEDILRLCELATVRQQPTTIIGTADAAEFERLTNDMARVIAERDTALGKVTGHGVMMGALLFIARSRFAPDGDPFMNLLRKTARDALDEAGIDWAEVDPAQLTRPSMEPLSVAAKPTGGRSAPVGKKPE